MHNQGAGNNVNGGIEGCEQQNGNEIFAGFVQPVIFIKEEHAQQKCQNKREIITNENHIYTFFQM